LTSTDIQISSACVSAFKTQCSAGQLQISVSKLPDEYPRNRVSSPGRDRFFSSPKCS